MKNASDVSVAVLLATYNGAKFVEEQLVSLTRNSARFILHWIDDHSTDDTRQIVRAVAAREGINVQEWHRDSHQGVPGTFFDLLERVEADIYLFCDQDDIWQPGKIDVAVRTLAPDLSKVALCSSDFLMFRDREHQNSHRLSVLTGLTPAAAVEESRLFMAMAANGHAQGFTRPLRDLFIKHKHVAREYAYMHDEWMHNLAVASGSVRFLSDVPTTLFRWHGGNTSGAFFVWRGKNPGHLGATWEQRQRLRRVLAHHARGFILAAPTLPPSEKLERVLKIARVISTLDQRQSLFSLVKLIRDGVMWPSRRLALGLAATCLCSSVPP